MSSKIGTPLFCSAPSVGTGTRKPAIVVLGMLVCLVIACVPARQEEGSVPVADIVGLSNLDALVWMQTAVEYRGTTLQAYALGSRLLGEALADPTWTAFTGQTDDFEASPTAVILDIDETVLDNSYYQARLVLDHQTYTSENWSAWVEQEAATAIPGAVEFIADASARGVTVFLISNREAALEEPTRRNLAAVGVALPDDADTVLLQGERTEWTSDKTSRFEHVAASHRIVLMFGDNMGDFTSAYSGSVAQRQAFADAHRDWWGSKWITLANPTYGSWLDAVLERDRSLDVLQQIERKRAALDPKR